MRRQPEPHLVPGNYPAAQRYIRRRKPPRILLCCIGTITCLLFMGSAAMLAVGYLNPFGTIGIAILGVGAVLYFGTILFLVLTCLWVEKKYPGMPPLSFKFISRKPPRTTPVGFTNPNISGQVATNTISGYRLHNEVPFATIGFNEQKTDNIPVAPKETARKKNDKQPSHVSSVDPSESNASQSNSQQEENCNAGTNIEDIPEVTAQTQTTNEDVNIKRDKGGKSTGSDATEGPTVTHIKDRNKNDPQPEQNENDNVSSSSPKRKVKPKTHHVEVPFEDYPSSDHSTSALSNNKDSSLNTQEPKPKDSSQQSSYTEEKNPSRSTDASISVTKPPINQEMASNMPQPHKKDQQTAQKASAPLPGRKMQDSSHTSSEQKSVSFESSQMPHERSQLASSSELHRSPAGSPAQVRKHNRAQETQNSQESSPKIKGILHTNSASPPVVRKETSHKRHENVPQSSNAEQKHSMVSPKASPVSAKKQLGLKKSNIPDSKDLVTDVQTSSLSPGRKNAFRHKHDSKHEPPNMTLPIDKDVLPQIYHLKTDFPEALPNYRRKSESPERQKKFGKDNKLPHSPPKNRRNISASPPRYHQRSPDISPKAQRNQDQSLIITSHPKKEEIQRRQNDRSSQSSDVPSSTSSSSPKQRQRNHARQSSPSSQSSDVLSSPSSSPSRHRQGSPKSSPKFQGKPDSATSRTKVFYPKSSPSSQSSDDVLLSTQKTSSNIPDLSSKVQRNKDIHGTKVELSLNSKKTEFHKMPIQQSSQTKDTPHKFSSSPLTAKKLLQYNKSQQSNSAGSQPTQEDPSGLSGEKSAYKNQTKWQHPDKNQRSPHSRETSPTAVRASPPSNKRLPPEDQS